MSMERDEEITRSAKAYSRSVHRAIAIHYYLSLGAVTVMVLGLFCLLAYLASQS